MNKNTISYRAARKIYRIAKTAIVGNKEDYQAKELERLVQVGQPSDASLGVIFFAPFPNRFLRGGKLHAWDFLPPFCDQLRESGVRSFFASSKKALSKALLGTDKSVVVCIYREVGFDPSEADWIKLLDRADLVFNHPKNGVKIADKARANSALAAAGCPVPRAAESLGEDDLVFSNEVSDSGAATYTTRKSDGLDEARYNAEFIDTKRACNGREYYATMRLMCINDRITHCYMRLRDTAENDPSVHSKNTPQDSELINHVWNEVLSAAADQFEDIAVHVYKTFGSGFFAHDTLVDVRTGKAFICETGYKFNDTTYERQMGGIVDEVLGLRGFETGGDVAKSSAPVFLELVRDALRS